MLTISKFAFYLLTENQVLTSIWFKNKEISPPINPLALVDSLGYQKNMLEYKWLIKKNMENEEKKRFLSNNFSFHFICTLDFSFYLPHSFIKSEFTVFLKDKREIKEKLCPYLVTFMERKPK